MSGARGLERSEGQGELPLDSVHPIRPEDLTGKKLRQIPGAVIDTFNEIIAQDFVNGFSRVFQDILVERLEKRGLSREKIFEEHWLDIEDIYRGAGWEVEYDKPGYNESYRACFIFKPLGRRITMDID